MIIQELSLATEQLYFFLSFVEQYAKKIGDECGKELVNESEISRVVLLE